LDIQLLKLAIPLFFPQQCLVLFEAAVARKVIAYLLDLMTIRVCDLVRMLTSYASQIGQLNISS
jgi:hypothetical protein